MAYSRMRRFSGGLKRSRTPYGSRSYRPSFKRSYKKGFGTRKRYGGGFKSQVRRRLGVTGFKKLRLVPRKRF